jgi:hypothetical protein
MKKEVGQIYSHGNEKFLLAQVGKLKIALICIPSGNRWTEPVKVKNPCDINETEWEKITSSNINIQYRFTLTT